MSPELTPIEEFSQVYAARQDLQQRLGTAPELLRDVYEQGLSTADRRLVELAQDDAVKQHYIDLGSQVVSAAAELEAVAPTLESLGMTEQLEQKRAEIAAKRADSKMAAASYFFPEASDVQVVLNPPTPTAPAQAAGAETGEKLRHLVIRKDKKNYIKIAGKDSISLSRDLQIASGNEAFGRQLRVKAAEFLAQHPGQMFLRGPIVKACGLDPSSANKQTLGIWKLHIKPFLEDCQSYGFSFDGKPIIEADLSTAKRYKYGITQFNVQFEESQNPLRPKNETIFELPDGREAAGKKGRVLNMLIRANPDNLVTRHDVVGVGKLYEPAGVEMLTTPSDNLLSAIIATARKDVEDTDYVIIKAASGEKNPATNRSYPGYYMVENAELAAQERAKRAAEKVARQVGATPEEEPKSEDISMHEAAMLGAYFSYCSEALRKKEIDPIDSDVVRALNRNVTNMPDEKEKTQEQLQHQRITVFGKAMALLKDSTRFNRFVEELEAQDKDDPRIDLLMYLMDLESSQQGERHIRKLMAGSSDLVVTYEGGAGYGASGGRGYIVQSVSSHRFGENGEQI